MTWKQLLADGRVAAHVTSQREIASLLAVVDRSLKDASVSGLSADGSFSLAYGAALILAKTAIAAAGYRVKGEGAHFVTFEALELTLGAPVRSLCIYLETCRRKRNAASYDAAGRISDAEAHELVKQASDLRKLIVAWLQQQHPKLWST